MKVQYFTFVLNPVDQPNMFAQKEDKVSLFKRILLQKEPIKFSSYGNELALVNAYERDNYAGFYLGRKETLEISSSPEEEFKPQEIQNWPHSLMFINFDDDPTTGHRIAVQHRVGIFREPHVQLKALADEINKTLVLEGYVVEINAVTSERKFWETIEENKNKISKLILSFNAPNFLKLDSVLSDELKTIEAEYGATKTTIVLENPEGKLNVPHTNLINQGAEYITKGGGSYKLQVKNQRGYLKDKDNVETQEVIDVNLASDSPDIILQALDIIFNKAKDA